MTMQALGLLYKLRRAQRYEDAQFGIDFDRNQVVTMLVEKPDSRTINVSLYRNSINKVLEYLEKEGYITINDSGYGQVLHKGWHWGQVFISKLGLFLFKSILVPIFVAFITALITVWVTR